jgi:hypothetical protein
MNHGRTAAWLALLAAFFTADMAFGATPEFCKGGTGCAGSMCPTAITPAQAKVPPDACPFEGESQSAVNIFAWNEFIAFNWPATVNCVANPSKSIRQVRSGQQGPLVWQTQMSSDNVFVAPDKKPATWCRNPTVQALLGRRPMSFIHTAQTTAPAQALAHLSSTISSPTDVDAVGGVVTDQAGRWLRYERLMNQPEYQAIVTNNWYRLNVLNSLKSITLPTGSIEFKSAWKILSPKEIASGRYYTTVATVFNTPGGAKSPGRNPVTLGLVGLHIIHKTPTQGGFFWSTFEQVDNDSVFFNPHSSTPINKQTAMKPFTELNPKGAPINKPVEIKRINAIEASPQLNAYYQALLRPSVFSHYRLISVQWQTGGAPQGTPPDVANIVIETYVQKAMGMGKAPPTGCLACHIAATAANGTTLTDHSFLFLEAQ